MKVVIFCGGLGLRMRELSEDIPKPMIQVGDRPILWHIMRYYAYYGHRDFILCLGYKADSIKRFFLSYKEAQANNFVLSHGGTQVEQLPSEIDDWKITFVDTGLNTNIGQRLKRVETHLKGEAMFLATYGDNVTDAPLDQMIEALQYEDDKVATFLSVRSNQSFHVIRTTGTGNNRSVLGFDTIKDSDIRINGGFFVLRQSIFEYLNHGRELVPDALNALAAEGKLSTWHHDGFWAAMDTPKEMRLLDALYTQGNAAWAKWDQLQ